MGHKRCTLEFDCRMKSVASSSCSICHILFMTDGKASWVEWQWAGWQTWCVTPTAVCCTFSQGNQPCMSSIHALSEALLFIWFCFIHLWIWFITRGWASLQVLVLEHANLVVNQLLDLFSNSHCYGYLARGVVSLSPNYEPDWVGFGGGCCEWGFIFLIKK